MSKKIRILISEVTNPWFNLATEDWIFSELDSDCHTLFLWRNAETVVIGRNQNPWVECKTDKMEQDNVYLARRQSGGGAVFHDLGNTNFTFLSPKQDYDQQANFNIIINALKDLGIEATCSGRNDILIDNKKVSGSAFKHKIDRSFHHGTLLVNANMTKLGDYLNPHPLKLAAKGIKSVRSRVANLVEYNPNIDHQVICESIIKRFCQHHNQYVEAEILDQEQLVTNSHLNKYYEMMANWDWRFGKTPEFTHQMETRFDWGIMDLRLNVKNATINDVIIFSDALDINLIESIKEALLGFSYQMDIIHKQLSLLPQKNSDWEKPIKELVEWLGNEVY
ncbi:lipoate--protein ligase [Pasteurella skyensis]|uniref:lipoate--protein ligase n=1 Tax=Phocoenobacter skyensis TaxID=97481 RepID=A0AAJ6P073_9PAST|nr:lipoate--protein ligase [Pasteurella skyensis]MDP8162391.1 lipoate--protein ligase [Pasteurella skyensis]MDP8172275.1 lipoate--protein ligase [Pasteurella skyensis]MDP8177091.1 lipoate--protein ligase [Pasteurella skyensis]MDP8178530.1 lipoate--protein ligase [Pasteurella skyensis]MDP8182532.1 lipoate--protein ligase [Pasteurella skyensis]